MKKNKDILYLSGLIKESNEEKKNYMFFSNLRILKKKVDEILSMDEKKVDKMLSDGHDWANDHIATSKDDVEEVYNWLVGKKSK
jgi:DNA topoisomerase VI subunit B